MEVLRTIFRSILILMVLLMVLLIGYGFANYKADIPLEVLKEKYEFEDSQYMELDGMQVHYRIAGKGTL